MDSRDYLDPDGWPVISERDRLPLVWLLEGAVMTAKYQERTNSIFRASVNRAAITRLNEEREAVAYELTLPSWWHYAPVRAFRCCDKPKPPPKPTKPLYIWLRRG